MPLPTPRKNEEQGAFVGRCMSELAEEFPDEEQRSAVCYRQWRESKGEDQSWFQIRNVADGIVEVLLYDEIGSWGIPAAEFVRDLQKVKAATINLRVNSPGGDAFDGIAIYNSLKNHPAAVHAVVDGLAASSASFITQAADTVLMSTGSTMMIHEPHGMTIGDAQDHAKMAETLDKMGDNIASLYAGRAGGDEPLWRSRMRAESWYRAQEAVDIGLADGLVAPKPTNRVGIFNLSRFKNVPAWVSQREQAPEEEPQKEPETPEPSPIAEAVREGVGLVVKKRGLPPFDFKQALKAGTAREGE